MEGKKNSFEPQDQLHLWKHADGTANELYTHRRDPKQNQTYICPRSKAHDLVSTFFYFGFCKTS